jgi:glycosyltransferase involved in cell wall biosynthesis
MKVTISVGGRFHAFDLAKQLQSRGFLRSLITSYPKWKVNEWGIPKSKISTIISHELLSRAFRKMGRSDLDHDLNCRYDRIAAKKLQDGSDLVVAWSGKALNTISRAKEFGAKTILERSSAHIGRQHDILQEERELTGAYIELPDPRTIAQELEEYGRADYISVPSNFVFQSFVERGFPPDRLLLVNFGVDVQHFKPIPKRDSKFRIIHSGSLSLRKGVHYLLRAFHELNLKDAELWLIGRPTSEIMPFLQRYGRANVILKGTFQQSRLFEQYSQGSVLCMASIEEGLAMVIPQAMACELPIIGTLNTGAKDIVRDSIDGFVIPIRDVEALKERLSFLYSHPNQGREMGETARKRILESFTWDHYGDQIVKQYARALCGANPQSRSTMKESLQPAASPRNAFSAANS